MSYGHKDQSNPRQSRCCPDVKTKAIYPLARCLSVRPSVTRRHSVETADHIMKLFHCRALELFHTKSYDNIQMAASSL